MRYFRDAGQEVVRQAGNRLIKQSVTTKLAVHRKSMSSLILGSRRRRQLGRPPRPRPRLGGQAKKGSGLTFWRPVSFSIQKQTLPPAQSFSLNRKRKMKPTSLYGFPSYLYFPTTKSPRGTYRFHIVSLNPNQMVPQKCLTWNTQTKLVHHPENTT